MKISGLGRSCEKFCSQLERYRWFPPLLARISVGWIFAESGWGKLHNLDRVSQFFDSLGIPLATVQAPFVSIVELVGGILLMVGAYTRGAAFFLSATMFVALITAKRDDIRSFSDLFGASEYLYLVLLIWLFVYGAGKVSLDAKLKLRCR